MTSQFSLFDLAPVPSTHAGAVAHPAKPAPAAPHSKPKKQPKPVALFDLGTKEELRAEKKAQAVEDSRRRERERIAADVDGERLLQLGFVRGRYQLDIESYIGGWGCNTDLPYPWNLPSRTFIFPADCKLREGRRPIRLTHPGLVKHPLVSRLIEAGFTLDLSEPKHICGSHAGDLLVHGETQGLLDTLEFCSGEREVYWGIGLGLRQSDWKAGKGAFTTADARRILAHLNVPEPVDGSVGMLGRFSEPHGCKDDGKKTLRYAVNEPGDYDERQTVEFGRALAWAYVHGFEKGWFARDKGGHVQWIENGRKWWAEVNRRAA